MNLNTYSHSKKDIVEMYLRQKGGNIIENYTLIAIVIHVPVIVLAFWVGEHLGWPEEVVDNIEVLIKCYDYRNIVGIPESYPRRKE